MNMAKIIQHGKEKHCPYHGNIKVITKSCRNQGGCPYCRKTKHKRITKKA